jgi:hypothetical protein
MAKNAIMALRNNEYELCARGSTMRLTIAEDKTCEMVTSNASSQAWNRGHPSVRQFNNIAEVEKSYKSWRGISLLLECNTGA